MIVPAKQLQSSHFVGKAYQITLPECFDYTAIDPFSQLKNTLHSCPIEVVIDMHRTRCIDSSGIALLFCLWHWIKAPEVSVRVINATSAIAGQLKSGLHGSKLIID